ncbi:MAG: restriction endonuclease subunit S [Candidatus Gracilibacteria bacterium]|nr:restriction endonuclease subunit S [Candidatus Gracilibacteria bacterium]
MTFQQYIKQKNLDISIISFEEIIGSSRIDSEYFQLKFINLEKNIKSKEFSRLESITQVNGGKRLPKGETFIDDKNGVPYVRIVDIQSNFIDENSLEYISYDLHNLLNRYQIKNRDILVSIVGTLGLIGYNQLNLDKFNFTENCARLRTKLINPEYLLAVLISSIGQLQVDRERVGTNQPKLSLDRLRNFLIPISSSEFQKAVGDLVLESLKQKELSKKLYLEAEKLLLSELGLEDYKPTEQNISIKDSQEVELFGRVDAEFFQPKYDEIIEKIKNYKGGYDFLRNLFKQNKESNRLEVEKINYIEIGDINISNGEIIHNEIEKDNLPANAKILLKKDDLLVSTVRPYRGAIAIVRNEIENLVGSGAFTVLREKTSYKKETLQILLKLNIYKELMLRYNCGASYPVIKDEDVLNLPISKIDIKVQEKIAELVKQSHISLDSSKQLLEKAKKSVEIFIEKDEKEAEEFLNS